MGPPTESASQDTLGVTGFSKDAKNLLITLSMWDVEDRQQKNLHGQKNIRAQVLLLLLAQDHSKFILEGEGRKRQGVYYTAANRQGEYYTAGNGRWREIRRKEHVAESSYCNGSKTEYKGLRIAEGFGKNWKMNLQWNKGNLPREDVSGMGTTTELDEAHLSRLELPLYSVGAMLWPVESDSEITKAGDELDDEQKGQKFIVRTDHRSLKYLLFQQGRLAIPSKSQWIPKLISEFHDTPSSGHSGAYRLSSDGIEFLPEKNDESNSEAQVLLLLLTQDHSKFILEGGRKRQGVYYTAANRQGEYYTAGNGRWREISRKEHVAESSYSNGRKTEYKGLRIEQKDLERTG
ncbi:hypothetical protein GH714_019254 [Hevea brasiliensis]|uniref:Uncharacterized protein n=1 Tax=Hevea brasiliensis TaxID=3981 RepID=A0A6A6MTT7_HEVBR|nr:hypothetical protein GH714_019254 [Hevea brasiliensis]